MKEIIFPVKRIFEEDQLHLLCLLLQEMRVNIPRWADLLVWNISLFLFKQETSGKSKINITGSSTEEHIPEALS